MSAVAIGTFAVSADADEVAAFRRAARLEPDGSELPFTWPIRWMARPDVRAALTTLLPEPGLVPFHESQSFDYAAPLRAGVDYAFAVSARRESAPARLVVEGRIAAAGEEMATMETVLRLFAMTIDDA